MSLPESIRSAAEGRSRRRLIGVRMRVSRGQIRSIRCSSVGAIPELDTPERMVLVLRVDTKREFSEVMLVHPYLELATSLDLVVTPEFSTIPYSVVVETDTPLFSDTPTGTSGTSVGLQDPGGRCDQGYGCGLYFNPSSRWIAPRRTC